MSWSVIEWVWRVKDNKMPGRSAAIIITAQAWAFVSENCGDAYCHPRPHCLALLIVICRQCPYPSGHGMSDGMEPEPPNIIVVEVRG